MASLRSDLAFLRVNCHRNSSTERPKQLDDDLLQARLSVARSS
jgi:hypothetical protein